MKEWLDEQLLGLHDTSQKVIKSFFSTIQERLFKYIIPKKRPDLVNKFVERWTSVDCALTEIQQRINSCDRTLMELCKGHTLEFETILN